MKPCPKHGFGKLRIALEKIGDKKRVVWRCHVLVEKPEKVAEMAISLLFSMLVQGKSHMLFNVVKNQNRQIGYF